MAKYPKDTTTPPSSACHKDIGRPLSDSASPRYQGDHIYQHGHCYQHSCCYQHSRYAGGLADCYKHQWLCFLLAQLAPESYLETHAGAGVYRLADEGRWREGFALLDTDQCDGLSSHWIKAIGRLNDVPGDNVSDGNKAVMLYPGSPWLARMQLGGERLVLFELEMAVADQLRAALPDADVRTGDGFSSVVHLLESQQLLMIDPPYTDLYDFDRALMLLNLVIQRQEGSAMLWYPLFDDQREQSALTELDALLELQHGWCHEVVFAQMQGSLRGCGVCVVGADKPDNAQQASLAALLAPAGIKDMRYRGQ